MINNLPTIIPIFPLKNAIFFPKTDLPLNIFELRYLQMIKDCLKKDSLLGMVQSKKNSAHAVFNVGCLGKITSFYETEDGTFLINLSGLIRFNIFKEIENKKLYREFAVDYSKFSQDIKKEIRVDLKTTLLIDSAKFYFNKKNIIIDWQKFKSQKKEQQIDSLAMIAPFSVEEKQIILETISYEDKINMLSKIIKFSIIDYKENQKIH